MVRFHSRSIQGGAVKLPGLNSASSATEDDVTKMRLKPELLSADGEILVFAPPILIGFLGAPLALADSLSRRRHKGAMRKNWARRRAYAA